MRILVVAPTPFFSNRGTHIRILEEALALEKLGHEIEWFAGDYVSAVGHAGMLVRNPQNGEIEADHDPRADGGALGV